MNVRQSSSLVDKTTRFWNTRVGMLTERVELDNYLYE